jgi:uncharacterized protein
VSDAGGITDLTVLLRGLEPQLDPVAYVFVTVPPGAAAPAGEPVVQVVEAEGTTHVVPSAADASDAMARITLQVHSSLAAVGLTATVATALAEAGISCNVVAGYFHDHLFVPVDRADEALAVLRGLRPTGA